MGISTTRSRDHPEPDLSQNGSMRALCSLLHACMACGSPWSPSVCVCLYCVGLSLFVFVVFVRVCSCLCLFVCVFVSVVCDASVDVAGALQERSEAMSYVRLER